MAFKVPEKYRIKTGRLASDEFFGNNGAFSIPLKTKQTAFVVASDGMGWEHVSASIDHRPPFWGEMCQIKDLFWGEDDWVMQFHPARAEYINCHPHCLHLWRPVDSPIAVPPSILVGPKS